MKTLHRSFLAILATVWLTMSALNAAHGLDVGDEAPDFSLSSGEKLSDLTGTVVYIDFWASWCTPCLLSFPWMERIAAKYRTDRFRLVTINVDEDRADAERFLSKTQSKLPVVFDPTGALPKQYGLMTMPTAYLIDSKRRVASIHAGFREGEKDAIEQKISQLIQEQR
jgi:cytochrome c biogenesis protein CcmG, thiol:disulfide interchange protein DsbE